MIWGSLGCFSQFISHISNCISNVFFNNHWLYCKWTNFVLLRMVIPQKAYLSMHFILYHLMEVLSVICSSLLLTFTSLNKWFHCNLPPLDKWKELAYFSIFVYAFLLLVDVPISLIFTSSLYNYNLSR